MYAQWGPNRKELYYLAPGATLMTAPVSFDGPTISIARPTPLFRPRIYGGGTDVNLGLNYDVSRDGRFLVNVVLDDAAATPITILQNWNPLAGGN